MNFFFQFFSIFFFKFFFSFSRMNEGSWESFLRRLSPINAARPRPPSTQGQVTSQPWGLPQARSTQQRRSTLLTQQGALDRQVRPHTSRAGYGNQASALIRHDFPLCASMIVNWGLILHLAGKTPNGWVWVGVGNGPTAPLEHCRSCWPFIWVVRHSFFYCLPRCV